MSRLKEIKESPTVKVIARAAEFRRTGFDIIDLSFGETRFDTPINIKDAAIEALKEGYTHYTHSMGLLELREAIAEKLSMENGIDVNPQNEILVTIAKFALYLAVMAVADAGDEIIISDPCYPSYKPIVRLAGCIPVYVTLSEANDFHLDIEELESKISPKTKLVIINSPHNPTGSVLSKGELEAIADIVRKRDLYVISDEVYEKYVYDGRKHYSIASLPGMKDWTITVNSFSKSYAMTGWRVGYAVANKDIIKRMNTLQGHTITCICAFAQKAAIKAFKTRIEIANYCDVNRKLLVDGLNEIPGVRCKLPEGTFYAFPNISKLNKTSAQAAEYFLEKAHVLTTPGSAFGVHGEGYLRVSYAVEKDIIISALERLQAISN